MILFTNENNPSALKVLIAANFAVKEIDLKVINCQDKNISEPKHLPYLIINDDTHIFIPNAAAEYLFPIQNHEETVNEWMEWESTCLSPSLACLLGSSAKSDNLKSTLLTCLNYLNESILSHLSLTGDIVALCDVVIWSTLYPLYVDKALSNEFLTALPNLMKWLEKLETQPEFKKAIAQYKVGSGSSSYNALLTGSKYCNPSGAAATSNINIAMSPQQSVDTVSPEEISFAKEAWLNGASRLPPLSKEANLVLPIPGKRNILITSALPYVNNVPHLGNIIGCVLSADVFARFCRLCNHNTLYICGTDEYGTATETKALEEGLTPQQICDKYFEIHNNIYRWFNIGFDYFGRTTTPEQTKITQEMFLELNKNGFMQTQPVEQLLCQKCNRYLADRFVEGGCPNVGCTYEDARGDQCDGCGKLVNATELKNPRCKMCGQTPVVRTSKQFFLDLPKVEPLLFHWMEKSSPGWSNNARVIAKSWMKEGLKPRCITRDLKWGVPVPVDGFRDKVFYVWFDAPIGYISITARYTKQYEKWWKPDPGTSVTLYQFMAKDNVPFHSVMFPATLLGRNQGYTIVSHIMATEYLNYEDGKFSKSRGVGVFGNDAQNTGIPSDVWRFYLLYVRPENQDSSFSWVDLATKNNSELLNNLGNFVNRALVFAEKNFDGIVPNMKLKEEDYTLLALCNREIKDYLSAVEKCKLRDGIRHILSISRHGNQYMQSQQPWVLLKGNDEEKERAGTVIGLCCNITCLLATLLFPYMPETSRIMNKQLNAADSTLILSPENPSLVNLIPAGHKLGKPAPLFTKIEPARVEELKTQFAGKQQSTAQQKGESGSQDIASLEAAVAKQGENVRLLKSSGTEKAVWQPEVTILLDLKKKLEAAQKSVSTNAKQASETASSGNGVVANPEDIKKMQDEIDKQALLVRNLKSSGTAKADWQPQVDMLIKLKAKLAIATGAPPALPSGAKSKKK